MHSIERYGIVALLFLVVTVVAVLMWDGGKKKKPEEVLGKNPAPVVEASAPHAIDPQSRLSLVAPNQPGPLVRNAGNTATPAADAHVEVDSNVGLAPAGQSNALTPAQDPAASALTRPGEEPAPSERPIASQPRAEARSYVVKSGDTLSEIAQRELGSSRRWQEIVALNPGLDPGRLRSGKTIQLPGGERVASAPEHNAAPASPPASAKEPAAGARTHKVAKGENLWKIAERALGDGKRWREIAALNPSVNPDRLVLGQVLKLPAGAPGAPRSSGTRKEAEPKAAKKEPVVAAADDRPARRGSRVK